ncbi:MAG: hypothetical protein JKY26_09025 [Pseudomonas sp.]|nr:hypothetical protein [Pseudomonas sp.]
MHVTTSRLSSIALSLVLGIAASHVAAQPPENRGKPDKHPGKHSQQADNKDRYEYGAVGNRESIDIEEALIREIFREQRNFLEPAANLPPGIQKNLARGKPLPPGIAKRFDGRLQSRLPSYPGYDWRQVGTNAVLIDATTGIVEAIIADILQ